MCSFPKSLAAELCHWGAKFRARAIWEACRYEMPNQRRPPRCVRLENELTHINVTTGLRPMIARVSRAKEPIRLLGRLVRVALIPQTLGLCLIACSQTVGQGPATHGVASACQADNLTELVKKLEAAALDDSFFKPGFVTDSALLRFFGARVITWKNIPSLQARSANLDDFGLPDAPRRTRADPMSSMASVELRMDNNGIFEVTIFLLQGDSAQDVSYQIADRIFAKAWKWRKSDVPPPPLILVANPQLIGMATPFWTLRHPIAASIGMHSCNSGATARSPT